MFVCCIWFIYHYHFDYLLISYHFLNESLKKLGNSQRKCIDNERLVNFFLGKIMYSKMVQIRQCQILIFSVEKYTNYEDFVHFVGMFISPVLDKFLLLVPDSTPCAPPFLPLSPFLGSLPFLPSFRFLLPSFPCHQLMKNLCLHIFFYLFAM